MATEIQITADGSATLFSREFNQCYHSHFGAVTESRHIFIHAGLLHAIRKFRPATRSGTEPLRVLEVGFGTGLNALLTMAEAGTLGVDVDYTAVEPHPPDENTVNTLNYHSLPGLEGSGPAFSAMHRAEWNRPASVTPGFILFKVSDLLETFQPPEDFYELIYFDAFDPAAQPALWTEEIFRKLAVAMIQGGILVTYSVKGTVVRALHQAGFRAEKLPGPPGKRHILRAVRNFG